MTNDKQSLTAYYEEKGKIRFMMVATKEYKEMLNQRCKQYGLTQGELLEVYLELTDAIDKNVMSLAVADKKAAKKTGRVSTAAVSKKLKGLPKDKLEAIEKFIEEQRLQTEAEAKGRADHGVFS